MKNAEKAQTIRKAVKTGVGEKRMDIRPLRKLGETRVGNESRYQKSQKKLRREKKDLINEAQTIPLRLQKSRV